MIRTVRLELARCAEFPEGSRDHGYELTLPLLADGRLDRPHWLKHRGELGFRRFWGDEDAAHGAVRHDPKGWSLSFASPDGGTDEAIFKGDEHRFAVGEYITIAERDGVARTFRVVSAE